MGRGEASDIQMTREVALNRQSERNFLLFITRPVAAALIYRGQCFDFSSFATFE
jgi:hypothetical protein